MKVSEQVLCAKSFRDGIKYAMQVYNKWDMNDPDRKMALGMFQELGEKIGLCEDFIEEHK